MSVYGLRNFFRDDAFREIPRQKPLSLELINLEKHRDRKKHNQYFTPEFAVEKALSLIPTIKPVNIIDPTVGNGIFLKAISKKWQNARLFGIDIDKQMLSMLNELNLPNPIFIHGDSLLQQTWEGPEIQKVLLKGGFDLVIGNPPYSSWFHRIKSKEVLSFYELGKNNGIIKRSQAIEVLFLELFIKITQKDGFIVIVLPDGILSNPQYIDVREFILKNTKVIHIINLPRNVFEDTSAKTSILILQKQKADNLDYFCMLHNLEKTGIINNIIMVSGKNLMDRMDYYYFNNLQKNPLQELVGSDISFKKLNDFIVYCKTGKTLYGNAREFAQNGLRFLHATNVSDIGIDYKKDERFINPTSKMNFFNAHAKLGDILFVRVGVGCAGRVAIVDIKDEEGVVTDYIHFFRVKNINPYFLVIYLKTKYGRWSIDILRHGVGTVSINKTDLLSIPIPVVSEKLQIEIERQYKNILAEFRIKGADTIVKSKLISLINYLEEQLQAFCINSKKDTIEDYYVEM